MSASRSDLSSAPEAQVAGIGLIGPGLPGWPAAAPVLAGAATYQASPTQIPSPPLLPPAERRRTGLAVRVALGAGMEAVSHAALNPAHLPCVFASSGGDGVNCHEICSTLASPGRALSPTRFHNSVHNVTAGYWSIATGARTASHVVCAHDGSFAAGLLEALVQVSVGEAPVLLVAYDTPYAGPLSRVRPLPDAFAVGFVLMPPDEPNVRGGLGRIRATLTAGRATRLTDAGLEALRAAVPAARSLPLLALLARKAARDPAAADPAPQTLVLDYMDGLGGLGGQGGLRGPQLGVTVT